MIVHQARVRLLRGATKTARVVGVTYGPLGRHCLIQRMGGLLTTRDGVSVAGEIELADPLENMGSRLLRDACLQVNREVGDGTTTTAILTAQILKQAHPLILAGEDPSVLAQSIRDAAVTAQEVIRRFVVPVRGQAEIARVASLASNGDQEIAEHLAEAAMLVGRDGSIVVEDGKGVSVTLEIKDGVELEVAPAHPSFLREGQDPRQMDGPLVAVLDGSLTSTEDVQDLMECASQWQPRELLVFTRGVNFSALRTLVVNDREKVLRCVAFRAPSWHTEDFLQDVAGFTGATFVSSRWGADHRKWDADWFGSIREASIKHKAVTLIPYDDQMERREEYLQTLRVLEASLTSDFDRDSLKTRMAKISGGLAILRVGGVTEASRKERRGRIEDALGSVRAALHGGLVPGAGTTYLRAAQEVPATPGGRVLARALTAPLTALTQDPAVHGRVCDHWANGGGPWSGFDVVQGCIRDLDQDPMVCDPLEVVLSALQASVSVATTLLTVEGAIYK